MDIQAYEELLLWNPNPPRSIIAGEILIEQTKAILFGAPKTFKSLLAQQLAICFVTGMPWLGYNVEPSKVLYIQGEISRIPFKGRIVKMGGNYKIPPQQLFFSSQFNMKLDRDSDQQDLEKEIVKRKPTILMIDPAYKFTLTQNEDSISRLLGYLDYLIDAHKICVILIHHSRKPRTNPTGQLIDMGGSELRGPLYEMWADSIIRVTGDIASDYRQLDFELRHAQHMINPITIKLDRPTLWFHKISVT